MYRVSHSILLIPFLAFAYVGCSRTATPNGNHTSLGTVKIEVELDDQIHSLTMEDVADGTSLEKVLRNVDEPKFVISGKDTSAFVESIGGKSTGAAEGWIFRIDGKFSNRGIGLTMLHPPTTVTWTYGGMEE